jgi:hypothetical protein
VVLREVTSDTSDLYGQTSWPHPQVDEEHEEHEVGRQGGYFFYYELTGRGDRCQQVEHRCAVRAITLNPSVASSRVSCQVGVNAVQP